MVSVRTHLGWDLVYVLGLLVLIESYVLTRVALDNSEQCRRLCWYRGAACVAYSWNPQPKMAPSSVSCLLHGGSSVAAADVPSGWVTKQANNAAITSSCQTRRCSETEVCLPGPYNSLGDEGYKCLPLGINCGPPSPRPNGTFSWTDVSLGQVSTLTCDPGFVLVPSATVVAPTITCLANGSWSASGYVCHQTEFHSPSIPFIARLPRPLFYGWEACVRGTFLGQGQMVYNFLTDQEDYANLTTQQYKNVTLQVAFRYLYLSSRENYTAFSRKTNNIWEVPSFQIADDMPLIAGQSFNLTFILNSSGLDVTLRGTGWSAFCNYTGLTPPLDLTQVMHLAIGQNVILQYVNTVSALPCL